MTGRKDIKRDVLARHVTRLLRGIFSSDPLKPLEDSSLENLYDFDELAVKQLKAVAEELGRGYRDVLVARGVLRRYVPSMTTFREVLVSAPADPEGFGKYVINTRDLLAKLEGRSWG